MTTTVTDTTVVDTGERMQGCRETDLVKFAVDVFHCNLQSFNGCSRRCRIRIF